MTELSLLQEREAIRDLVYRSCWLLDLERWSEWLALFRVDGQYELVAESPEIGREMCWQSASRDELAALLDALPNHVRDWSRRAHLVTVLDVQLDGGGATALSRFAVFRTTPQGETHSYAVGHYEDRLANDAGRWLLARRRVKVDTRMFQSPPHIVPL